MNYSYFLQKAVGAMSSAIGGSAAVLLMLSAHVALVAACCEMAYRLVR